MTRVLAPGILQPGIVEEPIPETRPWMKDGLSLVADLVVGDNAFSLGNLLAMGNVPVLADNRDRDKPAVAVVVAADRDRYWIVAGGRIVPYAQHGFTGDSARRLWLGENGEYLEAQPTGGVVQVVQVVAVVWDADHLLYFPPHYVSY